jgi:hypothetical protein
MARLHGLDALGGCGYAPPEGYLVPGRGKRRGVALWQARQCSGQ